MNTTTYVVGTAAVVVGGRLAQDKPIDVKIAVGAGAFAIGLSLIGAANPRLAQQFALLTLLTSLFLYGPAIVKKTGLVK